MKRVAIVSVLMALAAALAAEDDTVFKTYPLRMSQPDEIIEAVRLLAGEQGKVIHYKAANELIISATTNRHAQIAAFLAEVNAPSPNVRLDVNILQQAKQGESGAKVSGSGKVTISPKKGTTYHFKVSPEVTARESGTTENNRQTLVVQSGREAHLFVGREVPFYEWLYDFGRQGGYIRQDIELKKVGSSLAVLPTVVGQGPLINVKITPEITGATERGRTVDIKFTGVSTEVTIRDGETVTLGGFGKNSEFYDKFLVGLNRNGERQSVQITLTAHLQPLTK